jgi:hypothetical protein
LHRSELVVLAAIHDFPEDSVSELAGRTGLSESTVVKARARLAAEGFWGPWYDLDLVAVGEGSIMVHVARTHPSARENFASERIPKLLGGLSVPGVFFHEDGQLFGVTLPGTLEKAVAVEAAFLAERGGGSEAAVASFDSFAVPPRRNLDQSFVDYSHIFDMLLTRRPPAIRRGFATYTASPSGPPANLPTNTERAVILELLQRPGQSLEHAARSAKIARRTFARAKSSLRGRNVVRPAARANLFGLGFRYLLAVVVRHRPIASAERRARLLLEAVKGSVPVAGCLGQTFTVAVAPYYTRETAMAVKRRLHEGLPGVETLGSPTTLVFSYQGLKRAGFARPDSLGSTWLHTLWDAPSMGYIVDGGGAGGSVDRRRTRLTME